MIPCSIKRSPQECVSHHRTTFSAALGIIELYSSGKPDANFFVGTAAQLGVAYYATTISLNVIATCVICARLVYFATSNPLAVAPGAAAGGPIARDAGGAAAVRYYTGTLPVVVESALPYSAAGVAFLVSYGMQSDISILFGALYGMFTVSKLRSCDGFLSHCATAVVHLATTYCTAHRDGGGVDEGQDFRDHVCARVRGHVERGKGHRY